jgi:hypothetical protein
MSFSSLGETIFSSSLTDTNSISFFHASLSLLMTVLAYCTATWQVFTRTCRQRFGTYRRALDLSYFVIMQHKSNSGSYDGDVI